MRENGDVWIHSHIAPICICFFCFEKHVKQFIEKGQLKNMYYYKRNHNAVLYFLWKFLRCMAVARGPPPQRPYVSERRRRRWRQRGIGRKGRGGIVCRRVIEYVNHIPPPQQQPGEGLKNWKETPSVPILFRSSPPVGIWERGRENVQICNFHSHHLTAISLTLKGKPNLAKKSSVLTICGFFLF